MHCPLIPATVLLDMSPRKKHIAQFEIRDYSDVVFSVADICGSEFSWDTILGDYDSLTLELGMGGGRSLVNRAAANRTDYFVGVEVKEERMLKAVKASTAMCLKNISFILGSAEKLGDLGLHGLVHKILIQFLDPWPKKKHFKRRMTGLTFLETYRKILAPGGVVEVRTDNNELFNWSLEQFHCDGWHILEKLDDDVVDAELMTEFEMRFRKMDLPIYSLKAQIS
jgi:tRNA (guanine-N7-)-methyltransferase